MDVSNTIFLKDIYVFIYYLKCRFTQRRKNKENLSFAGSLQPELSSSQTRNQELLPGLSHGRIVLRTWVFSAAFLDHKQGAEPEVKELGLELVLIWDTDTARWKISLLSQHIGPHQLSSTVLTDAQISASLRD